MQGPGLTLQPGSGGGCSRILRFLPLLLLGLLLLLKCFFCAGERGTGMGFFTWVEQQSQQASPHRTPSHQTVCSTLSLTPHTPTQ